MKLQQPRRLSVSRTLSIVLALATIGVAGFVFEEKRQATKEAHDVAKLRRKIEAEKERISELNAEWALLDQPARLQAIVELHPDALKLEPLKTEQIGTIDDVPWKPAPPPETEAHAATAPVTKTVAEPAPAAAEAAIETPEDVMEETTSAPEVVE